jgi:hypothetical protein
MKRVKRGAALQCEGLEDRTSLSAGLAGHGGVAELARGHRLIPLRSHVVSGTISGSFQITTTSTGMVLNENGSGNLRGVGSVTSMGAIPLSSTSPGQFQGTIQVSAAQGTENLLLSGNLPSNTKKPSKVAVTAEGGTGSFAGETGSGSGTLKVSNLTSNQLAGNFTLKLKIRGS